MTRKQATQPSAGGRIPDRPDATLGQVMQHLNHATGLSERRRRDLQSAVRSIARMLGRRPEEIPADVCQLGDKLGKIEPAAFDISAKRFANIRADALAALRLAGITGERRHCFGEWSPEWRGLLDRIPQQGDRYKLSQFARFCSASGIEPHQVDEAVVVQFHEALATQTFATSPERTTNRTVSVWNRLSRTLAGWPRPTLTSPWARRPWILPLKAFPASLRQEVDAWLADLGEPDLFDENAPEMAMRQTTVKQKRMELRMFVSALVQKGRAPSEITALEDLVSPEALELGLGFLRERLGETHTVLNVARTLKGMARNHLRLTPEEIERLRTFCRRLGRRVPRECERNRRRLAQFEDDDNLRKLLHLPALLVRKARKGDGRPRSNALLLQAAAAIEILLYAPLRVGNLAALHLSENMREITVRGARCLQIHVPAEQVKNARDLHYELGPVSLAMLAVYLEHGRPMLLDQPSDYLFPATNGGPTSSIRLSRLITRVIAKHTGLEVNPHLFRSIAAKIHDRIKPGDWGTISHVLQHELATTMRAYANFERARSIRLYHQSLERTRDELGPARVRRAASGSAS